MSSKHTRYLRRIDVSQVTGNVVVFAGGGGSGATPAPPQLAATDVLFAPAGSIAARNVQGAIEELDAEKLGLAGGAMTGLLILSGHPTNNLGAATKWYVDNLDRLLVPGTDGVPVVRLLPDFIRIGHPLQPGLTWTSDSGVRLPASCVVGNLGEYVWHIEAFAGSPAIAGPVFYANVDMRVSRIVAFVQTNNVIEKAELLIIASTDPAAIDGTEASQQIGRLKFVAGDTGLEFAVTEVVYDETNGAIEDSESGDGVVSGDDPLIPAGSWVAIWEELNSDQMGNVTVTMFARYA